jgi:hypothetical protein
LTAVTIAYLPANQAPTVKIVMPQGGERWGKTQTVKWSGSDPDNDTLTYDLYYSTDNGATWQALDKRVKSGGKTEPKPADDKKPEDKKQPAQEEKSSEAVSPSQTAAQMKAELDSHPEISQEMKDKIIGEAPEVVKSSGKKDDSKTEVVEENADNEDKGDDSTPSKETSYSWNTSTIPDGKYVIKVVASDRTSNPSGYLTAEAISDPIIISNKAPELFVFKRSMTIDKDRSVKLEGYTVQGTVGISGVQFRADNGDWMAAAPSDGMYGDKTESFTITTLPLSRGSHTIEVKSIDTAGNPSTAKTQVTVP